MRYSEKAASWVPDDIRKALHKNTEVGFHERPDTSPGLHKEMYVFYFDKQKKKEMMRTNHTKY